MSKVSKIKINLTSGNVIEKPLVTCFKGTNGNYIVFDNETNGSMGLPIICISKFNGTAAEKIFDQNEWASVKENLKTIIAGTALPYLNVPEMITAQDDFFTQLTLPVASFDLLKSVYKPVEVSAPAAEAAPVAPASQAIPEVPASPVASPAPVTMEPTPISASEVIAPAPVIDAPIVNPAPIAQAPVIEPAIVTPVTPNVPVTAPVVETPTIEPAPAPAPQTANLAAGTDDIAVIKENFMKSCEMMFDALIKKFENK